MNDSQVPIRILAVDGDEGRQAGYRTALDGIVGRSYTLLPVDSGSKALSLVQTFLPECVLVATTLSDMSGMAFVERLGRNDSRAAPGVVLVAAPGEETAGLDGIRAGADDFLMADRLTPAQLQRAIGTASQIVSLRERLSEARQAAADLGFDDPLTHLATRGLFHNRVVHAVILAKRNDQNIGVMLLELSQLKEINILYGHEAGDAALREAAARLRTVLREADTVSRTSGNQFGILLQTGATYEGSMIAAQKIQQVMSQPFTIQGRSVDLTPDIGIALFPNHGDNSDTLFHHAETAMRQARRQGGGFAVFAYDDMLSDFLEAGPSVA